MGEKFWWIYDIISVVVIIFFVFSGARKGFSKILITALGCVASIAAAFCLLAVKPLILFMTNFL